MPTDAAAVPGAARGIRADLQRLGCGEVLAGELDRFSADFGQMVRKTPAAVVRPGGAADVGRVVGYAAGRGIAVATRGTGHSLSGQSLSEGGIVLDMSGLDEVHDVRPDELWFEADAGATWQRVIGEAAPRGVLPPVLPGYLHVSLGGTLSTVGWGAASFRHGPQIANCLGLEVVTGEGETVGCGPAENADLFHHVLGGLGQFGVITRVRHRLRRFQPALRTYSLGYPDLDALLADAGRAAAEGHAAHVEGFITRDVRGQQAGPWRYVLNVSVEAERLEEISDEVVLDGLEFPRKEWLRNGATVEHLASISAQRPDPAMAQPWLVMFLPRSAARSYVEFCLQNLPFPNLGGRGAILRVWPGSRRHADMPMLRLPDEEEFVLFAIFVSVAQAHLPAARALVSRAIDLGTRLGGKLHLGTWAPLDAARWRLHYGAYWPRLAEAKRRYDPAGIMGAGVIDFGEA